jgi:hypothetical protein
MVFGNWAVRRIFGLRKEKMVGGWRKCHCGDLHNLYSSPNTSRMIKSRRMRRSGHLVSIGEKRNAWRVLVRKLEGNSPL